MVVSDIGQMAALTVRGGAKVTIRLSAIGPPAVDLARLTSLQPQALAAPDGVILDCANTADAYQRGHIPGAAELYGGADGDAGGEAEEGAVVALAVWWSLGLLFGQVGRIVVGIAVAGYGESGGMPIGG